MFRRLYSFALSPHWYEPNLVLPSPSQPSPPFPPLTPLQCVPLRRGHRRLADTQKTPYGDEGLAVHDGLPGGNTEFVHYHSALQAYQEGEQRVESERLIELASPPTPLVRTVLQSARRLVYPLRRDIPLSLRLLRLRPFPGQAGEVGRGREGGSRETV